MNILVQRPALRPFHLLIVTNYSSSQLCLFFMRIRIEGLVALAATVSYFDISSQLRAAVHVHNSGLGSIGQSPCLHVTRKQVHVHYNKTMIHPTQFCFAGLYSGFTSETDYLSKNIVLST